MLSEFKYYYDEEIFMKLTRYEFGFWIIFVIFFFLRRNLDKCGEKKTMFDYMRP